VVVLKEVSLRIDAGEFIAIIGPRVRASPR
jgi:ABC-type phosphate/phosphonate transport system ATPase subunit